MLTGLEAPALPTLRPLLQQLQALRRVAAGQLLLGMELSAPPQPLLQHLIQALRRVAAGQLKVGMDSPAKPRPLTPRFQLRLASLPNKYEMQLAPVTFHLE